MSNSFLPAGRVLAPGRHLLALSPKRTLALNLTAAFVTSLANAAAADSVSPILALSVPQSPAHTLGQTWIVKNCDDSGPDSLRDIIANSKTQSGDSIDLSELPARCGMVESVIALGSEIKIQQDDLYLYGPTQGTVTISGAGISRVFHHYGSGTLSLTALHISEGYHHSMGNAYGGCIYSTFGSVFLSHAVVDQCKVVSDTGWATGGGISSHQHDVTLVASRVTGNYAECLAGYGGNGGGVHANNTIFAKYSTIDSNTSHNGAAGGLAARGMTLISSTVENNVSRNYAAIASGGYPLVVLNSTISTNSASRLVGGILAHGPTLISNSTIAFNYQGRTDHAGSGVYFGSSPMNTLTLDSSIIANNTAGASSTPADVFIHQGLLAGADNLVIASNVSDPAVITVTTDPRLGLLQFNGGRTRTHMLLPGSPALGKGNLTGLPATITAEQRGPGYPRTTGPSKSVDLGAVEFDSIFADSFDYPIWFPS